MQQTLILVPGLMCDAAVWQPLLSGLAPLADCRVVDPGATDSLTEMARRVLAQAPERFALAGHSMGGRVALEVMRLAPARVSHLGLFDTGYLSRPPGAAGEEEARKRQTLLDLARAQGVRAMAAQWVQGMVAPHRLTDRPLIDAILDMFERRDADTFAAQIRALLARPDASPVLQALRLPTLILCGEQDGWSPPSQHAAMAALMPEPAPVVCVPDGGHMSMMEQPEAVLQAMRQWLAQTGGVPC